MCFLFWFLFFLGCQSVRDRTAQAGAPIFKMFGFIVVKKIMCTLCQSVRDRTAQTGTDGEGIV